MEMAEAGWYSYSDIRKGVNMNRLYDDMISTADSFAVNFSDRGTFDYSFDSLTLAEELLDEMADYIFEDDEAVYNASTMIGAYVFETVRRNLGGEYVWLQKEEQPLLVIGLPDFSVSIKAWEKVMGRIINGSEDNIPFYVDGVIQCVEKGKMQKGYAATVV